MIDRLWIMAVAGAWPVSAFAQNGPADGNDMTNGYGRMNGYGHMMNFWGGGLLMWIFSLVLAGVVVYFLVKPPHSRGSGPVLHETPLDILKRRYAQGEISRQQFEEMKKDL